MLKTGDFATRCGVSKRHIDRLLKRHEEDLAGHFERREAGGTFLDEFAQDFLRGKLRNPMEILPVEEERSPKELKAELDELRKDLVTMSKMLADAEYRARKNGDAAALLEASDEEKKRLQKEKDELLEKKGSLEAQNDVLSADNEELKVKIAESEKNASEAKGEASDAKRSLAELKERNEITEGNLKTVQERLQRIQSRWWYKLFGGKE